MNFIKLFNKLLIWMHKKRQHPKGNVLSTNVTFYERKEEIQ
ncbi:hypothetical protein BCAH1134_C0483 (plasmid) [Bacillus cereus AH1134]|nr:hypothetical protein BCAH1134_C0483 [Bacillus cereus AH1134]